MTRADDTTTLADFQTHLRDHLDHSKSTNRPLVITTDGEPQAVLLSATAFDELMDQADLAKSLILLDRSTADIQAGRTTPAKAALRDIANQFDLKLDR